MLVAPEPWGLPGPLMPWALEGCSPAPRAPAWLLPEQGLHSQPPPGVPCAAWVPGVGAPSGPGRVGHGLVSLGEQLIRQIHPRSGKQAFGEQPAVCACMSSSSVNFQRDRHLTGFSGKSCQAKAQLSVLRSEFS